jgi:NAD(P)-dependent dehydrogenase (short-subunit alcohol dehydrogenase family)
MIWELTSNEQLLKETLATVPLRRLGEPEEVAELVCYLASGGASYIAGGSIAISGGTDI